MNFLKKICSKNTIIINISNQHQNFYFIFIKSNLHKNIFFYHIFFSVGYLKLQLFNSNLTLFDVIKFLLTIEISKPVSILKIQFLFKLSSKTNIFKIIFGFIIPERKFISNMNITTTNIINNIARTIINKINMLREFLSSRRAHPIKLDYSLFSCLPSDTPTENAPVSGTPSIFFHSQSSFFYYFNFSQIYFY